MSLAAEVLFGSSSDPENEMRDLLKKRQTDERRERRHSAKCKTGDEVLNHIRDTAMTTEDIVMAKETEKRIAEYTRRTLAQNQRIAWHRHVDDGLKQREIAAEMHVHESQVSRWLATSRTELKKTIDPNGF